MRQHYRQFVATRPSDAVAVPRDYGNTTFGGWRQYLWGGAALHPHTCSTAFKMQRLCLQNVAALPSHSGGSTTPHHDTAARPMDCSTAAFRMQQPCLEDGVALLVNSGSTTCKMGGGSGSSSSCGGRTALSSAPSQERKCKSEGRKLGGGLGGHPSSLFCRYYVPSWCNTR